MAEQHPSASELAYPYGRSFLNLRWLGEPNFGSACAPQPTVCGLQMAKIHAGRDVAQSGRVARWLAVSHGTAQASRVAIRHRTASRTAARRHPHHITRHHTAPHDAARHHVTSQNVARHLATSHGVARRHRALRAPRSTAPRRTASRHTPRSQRCDEQPLWNVVPVPTWPITATLRREDPTPSPSASPSRGPRGKRRGGFSRKRHDSNRAPRNSGLRLPKTPTTGQAKRRVFSETA
ncbi:hypothetical protein G1C96_0756 [Bifidobacterium sp. DSM 109958]|uniref:Uncharacterized protein n=1 Tax=Bifidobacterium moraviense TaxID=2675323 RepID=A0A7Y0F198_9BIFI|nr:hypothetical protein [Bifidobacterium sp. DSM 109958]